MNCTGNIPHIQGSIHYFADLAGLKKVRSITESVLSKEAQEVALKHLQPIFVALNCI